mmetsp:Transcript_21200/g.34291  ORF Transcript_21200/g.34291 Transcript_21200/m.34291 type:complete len:213 (-) Transcript_21200:1706-2344(-)
MMDNGPENQQGYDASSRHYHCPLARLPTGFDDESLLLLGLPTVIIIVSSANFSSCFVVDASICTLLLIIISFHVVHKGIGISHGLISTLLALSFFSSSSSSFRIIIFHSSNLSRFFDRGCCAGVDGVLFLLLCFPFLVGCCRTVGLLLLLLPLLLLLLLNSPSSFNCFLRLLLLIVSILVRSGRIINLFPHPFLLFFSLLKSRSNLGCLRQR